MKTMSGRVTLEDIAEASGASLATVSLALRNKPGVSRDRRERILSVARSLGYSRPVRATSEDGHAVRKIALIFRTPASGPERSSPALNRFYSLVLSGIQEAANDAQMNLVLGVIPVDDGNNPSEMPPARIIESGEDGVLLVGAFRQHTLTDILTLIGSRSTPVVLVDGKRGTNVLDTVGSLNQEGMITATRYLLERGHRKIAFAGPVSRNDPNFADRYAGYELAMTDAGFPTGFIPVTDEDIELPAQEYETFPFTGVVCGNDHGAWLLVRKLLSRGIRVPGDVSIIGFDDTDHARFSTPPLTTMGVDTLSMGRLAVQMLCFRLAWPDAPPLSTLIQPHLIERTSVRNLNETS